MIALNAILLCSTPGCERRCLVLARLRFEYDYVRLVPTEVPEGWAYLPDEDVTRCPACLEKALAEVST